LKSKNEIYNVLIEYFFISYFRIVRESRDHRQVVFPILVGCLLGQVRNPHASNRL